MKLINDLEIKGMKLSLTIESKDLQTHSRMQILSESDKEWIKIESDDLLTEIAQIIIENEQLGRSNSPETY